MTPLHRRTPLRLLALVTVVGLAACDTDSTAPNDPGPPPELPPQTSMSADFSFFAQGDGALGAPAPAASLSSLNFANAAVRVLAAQVVTVVALAVPAAVFAAAANNTPTFEDDHRWHWRFTAVHGGHTYVAHLSGVVEASDVVWDMRITSPTHVPPLDEFVWYGGRGRIDRSSGTWTFYDPAAPSSPAAVLRIDWSHTSHAEHGWTATALAGAGEGDVFTASADGDDRWVTYRDGSEQTFVEIYWNAADGTGYLIAPHYNGGVKACWDENQRDTPCA